jgi:hypothetical protein
LVAYGFVNWCFYPKGYVKFNLSNVAAWIRMPTTRNIGGHELTELASTFIVNSMDGDNIVLSSEKKEQVLGTVVSWVPPGMSMSHGSQ